MDRTDARTLGIEALNERRRRAVKLRLSGMKLNDVAAQAELSKGTITWLTEEFPSIADQATSEGAEIHWGDETGLRSDNVRGRG